jgi:acyl-homoserine lactone acylase PvdQ
MHTSTNVDVADMYAEKIVTKMTNYSIYNSELLPVIEKSITVKYLQKEN